MKIIHAADLHLGSRHQSIDDASKREVRRSEIRGNIKRLAEYARSNSIKVILLSGDIFDSDDPTKKDVLAFNSVINDYSDIDFIYLKGNHDKNTDYNLDDDSTNFNNLKTFSLDNWSYYSYKIDGKKDGNTVDNKSCTLVIAGREINDESSSTLSSFYTSLNLNKEDINIVMLHGDISGSSSTPQSSYPIIKKSLMNKNIDYLALGHIHKISEEKLDNRGYLVYPGCLEGRGFDEYGDHGFYLIDIDEETFKLSYSFISFCNRKYVELDIDVSDLTNENMIVNEIKKVLRGSKPSTSSTSSSNSTTYSKDDIYRFNLVGEVDESVTFDLSYIKEQLINECFYISLKNKSTRKIDYSKYENELSVRGEYIKLVKNDPELSEEMKTKMIHVVLRAFDNKEIDL